MKRYLLAVFLFGLMAILTAGAFYLSQKTDINQNFSTNKLDDDSQVKPKIEDYGKLPLAFEKNLGQTDEQVKFLSRGAGYTLFLTESEAVMTLWNKSAKQDSAEKQTSEFSVLRMKTVGGNSPAKIEGQDAQIGRSNYLIGEDSQKWLRDVPHFSKVRYSEIYSGVDLVYYGNGRQLEYDFVVQPNADFKQIKLEFEGAKTLRLSEEGDLMLELENGSVRQHKPIVYQETGGARREIAGNYVLKNEREVGFEIGEYDASLPLVIDPVLAYATYLGSVEYEESKGIAVDAAGNAYVTGYAYPPAFPTTPGSVRPTLPNPLGHLYTFVAKFNSTGSALVYSTYLGGAGEGIAVDAEGNAYTTGYSLPTLFTPTPGALDAGDQIGVTKLNPQGNQRIYAARFGSSGDDIPTDIAIDSAGNAYVTGHTNCAGAGSPACDFPVLNAPQPNYRGNGDMFVSKLNAAGSALIYSTYVGGGSIDNAYSIDIDNSGNAYITGFTLSSDFPTTPGAFDTTYNCNPQFNCRQDAIITKIPPSGGTFAYSTYLGGTGEEFGYGIAVDDTGNAYVAGYSGGRFSGAPEEGFPTTPGAFKMFGSVEAFVAKLNSEGSALVYATLLGGVGSNCFDERARDVDVDRQGNAYVVGMTTCPNFPVVNALQPAPTSFREEAFLTKFNQNGTNLVYSTYLGGPRYDEAYHVAVQPNGAAYVTGTTSGDFQLITPGAYDSTWNGADAEHPDDIFVLKVEGEAQALAKPADFDGDGRTDISVFRPSDGNWHYLRSGSNGSLSVTHFGATGDVPVAADYDGDGKSDFAVFRQGIWYILNSSNNSFRAESFGLANDKPVTGDFDGDGKADLAVYRDGIWYEQRSGTGFFAFQFGTNTDKPVAADYDGDGKTDIGVWRASTATWYIVRSFTNTIRTTKWGVETDKPVPADYDGDGKADISVWRSGEGMWYVIPSELQNGRFWFKWGIEGDIPVSGYYDGDNTADFAVFRPSNGVWYIQPQVQTNYSVAFGAGSDITVPASNFR
jgi:hypothetical protein